MVAKAVFDAEVEAIVMGRDEHGIYGADEAKDLIRTAHEEYRQSLRSLSASSREKVAGSGPWGQPCLVHAHSEEAEDSRGGDSLPMVSHAEVPQESLSSRSLLASGTVPSAL